MAVELLTAGEIDAGMSDLPDWRREGGELIRTMDTYDFRTAARIVDKVVTEAQKLDHHPDVDIRYGTLRFALSTHSAGGITPLDVALAHRIEEAAGHFIRSHD